MTAGSVWLLVKVSTFNKSDNCLTVYELHELSRQPNNFLKSFYLDSVPQNEYYHVTMKDFE